MNLDVNHNDINGYLTVLSSLNENKSELYLKIKNLLPMMEIIEVTPEYRKILDLRSIKVFKTEFNTDFDVLYVFNVDNLAETEYIDSFYMQINGKDSYKQFLLVKRTDLMVFLKFLVKYAPNPEKNNFSGVISKKEYKILDDLRNGSKTKQEFTIEDRKEQLKQKEDQKEKDLYKSLNIWCHRHNSFSSKPLFIATRRLSALANPLGSKNEAERAKRSQKLMEIVKKDDEAFRKAYKGFEDYKEKVIELEKAKTDLFYVEKTHAYWEKQKEDEREELDRLEDYFGPKICGNPFREEWY